MYRYRAKLIRVVDGDTIVFAVDLGFKIWMERHVRLYQINTPELRGLNYKKAKEVKKFVEDVLASAVAICIETIKDKKGKYGRYLAIVEYIPADNSAPIYLNEQLKEMGYEKKY